MKIDVLVADDHTIVRDGLRLILESQGEIQVVGEAADGLQVIQQVFRLHPDVIVMDISMPNLNGIEATERIRKEYPKTQVVVLSMYSTMEHIYRALRAGAQGYLLKESAGKEVVAAVHAVYNGQRYLSQKITETMIDDYIHLRQEGAHSDPLEGLSARERQVLQMVAEGKTSEEIAERLHLSTSTVDTYRSRLMKKLNIKDLPSLIRFAIELGLV